VEHPEDLAQLYFGYEQMYNKANSQVVSLGTESLELAQLTFDKTTHGSYCALVFGLLQKLSLLMDVELQEFYSLTQVHTLLLYGIEQSSVGLSDPSTPPSAFLATGRLLEAGAKRLFSVGNLKPQTHKSSKTPKTKKPNLKEVEIK
jgi:hypothetical protein